MSTRNRTVLVLVAVAMAMLGLTMTSASADVILKVDFNSNQDGGGDSTAAGDPGLSAAAHHQEGWSSYHANHEVIAEFSTADYDGITVTPDWPNTTANTARQSIDRGSGNDANWDNAAGDINLMTDFIGIDTRTANGGNGDWDGTTGTPTYMTLALGGLAAGNYDWTSYHHDTEHCHGPFAVWLSTDGGETFTQLDDGIMTDSTPGGTPDSGATEAGPDANSLPSTYHTSFRADGVNDVVFRFAPYSAEAVHRQIWGMNGFVLSRAISLGLASSETPANQATDVPYDTALSWTPGEFAQTHDLYVGTVFEDVNEADRANPMDVLVSQDQSAASYAPEGVWEFGQTYYWRIDEVNGAPDNTIYKGEVWSFTVEPLSYPIEGVVATSNGTSDAGSDVENTVNGSGLDADDLHSVESSDMWLATPGDEPLYIQYEFDRVYKLHEMLVWNYNVQFEIILGFGLKDVTVEYSVDGEDWTVLGDVQFAKATARADYFANTVVDFGGVPAQFVRLNVNSGHGTMGQFGLSEVRFLFIPAQAREPQPADGAADVAVDSTLAWRAGRHAVSHEVYLGTDPNALEMVAATDGTDYDPGALNLGNTYYWQVNAVQEAESWDGAVWSFATQEYLVVDDFESYTDDIEAGEAIFDMWLDGWVNDTGSTVGYFDAPFAEKTIVRSGSQSMPLFYDNTTATVSEAEFELAADWTANGIRSLSLYFYGDPDNTGQLYVKINNTKVPYDGAADDLKRSAWQPWNIDLSAVGNVSNVQSLTIGIEGAGATGVLYIDDVRLYPDTPDYIVPVEPDDAGLVAYYSFDDNVNDGSGNGHHGAIQGTPTYVAGVQGNAIDLNGSTDYVSTDKSASDLGIAGNSPRTVTVWVYTRSFANGGIYDVGARTEAQDFSLRTLDSIENRWRIQYWGGDFDFTYDTADRWVHFAHVHDGTHTKVYADGVLIVNWEKTIDTADTNPFQIGQYGWPGNYFDGQIDELRLYNRALSAEEVLGAFGQTEPVHKPF